MKIRLLNDFHRESGPFTYEDQGEDVVVLAGDIGNGVEGIEWAKTIPKPVIMVAGNHEFWDQPDFHETLTAMKQAARGSNVRFLERNAVKIKINGETVRFLGCTLWTNYCNGSRTMYEAALASVRDYDKIKAEAWNERNQKRLNAFQKKFKRRKQPLNDDLHPLMLHDIHRKSVAWLEAQLKKYNDDIKNVIVTHHAPTMESLVEARMVDRHFLGKHDEIRTRGEEAFRMSAYASDLNWIFARYGRNIDLWCHGHVHEPLDYVLHGVRIACNPRGYHSPMLINRGNVPLDVFARNQALYENNPERGSVHDFDRAKVIDLNDGILPIIKPQMLAASVKISALADELQDFVNNAHIDAPELRAVFLRAGEKLAADINVVREEVLAMFYLARIRHSTPGPVRISRESWNGDFNCGSEDLPARKAMATALMQAGGLSKYFASSDVDTYLVNKR